MRKPIFLFLVVVLFSFAGCLQSNCTTVEKTDSVCENKSIPQQKIVCENVSYSYEACEKEEIPFDSTADSLHREVECVEMNEECEKYVAGGCSGYGQCLEMNKSCVKYQETASFSIANLGDKKGTWVYKFLENSSGPKKEYSIKSLSVAPGETRRITESINSTEEGSFLSASLIQKPTKSNCRQVEDTKENCSMQMINVTKKVCENVTRSVKDCS